MKPDRGALALVLHSHMPYVEGFGTWPFGEEWLWEAVATVYLPLLDLLEETRAPVTLGLTPVLCDQLETLPGPAGERLLGFLRETRRLVHEEDSAGLERTGHPELGAEVRRAGGDYERAAETLERDGRDLLARIAALGSGGPVELWTSSATHALLPLLASDDGPAPAAGHRHRLARAALRLLRRRALAARVRLRARPRARAGRPRRARHVPRPDRRARLRRARAPRAGAHAGRGDRGADRLGQRPARVERRDRVPRRTPSTATTTGARCTTCARGATAASRTVPSRPRRWPASTPSAFVERCIGRLDAYAAERGRPGLLTFALDTELLGHWWYEGQIWLRAVFAEASAQGLRLATVSEALEEIEPVEREPAVSSWGAGKDFSTWDSPKVAEMAFAARGAELRTVAAAAGGAHSPDALARAARELLALQSSDWAFQETNDLASDYPRAARGRTRGRQRRSSPCSGRLRVRAGPRTAQPGARPHAGFATRPVSARVLILSWEYPPLIEGGLARHVRKLAEGLAARGVQVHVLARGREEDPAEEEVEGVMVHRVLEPERPRDLTEFVTWIEHMNADMLAAGVEVGDRYSFDVVHGHDWLVASAGDHLAKRFRCPFVVTVHATETGRHQGWVDKHPQSYIHGVERWMTNRAERVVTCSAYMREHVADVFGLEEERIAVIPNGIDPSELVPVDDLETLRSRFASPDERLVLLVGRLVYEKGFQLALEALPGLIERVGNVRYLVAGSGTAERELREQASALGLDDHGTFLGWIGDDVLHSLYRIADLTVVPSIYEPFGLVALEAMASGCPCLVADTGGLREVVPNENVGLRFRSRDPESLGQMAERVLTDAELRDRLVAEASEHVLSFDWADVAAQVVEVYEEAIVSSVAIRLKGSSASAGH